MPCVRVRSTRVRLLADSVSSSALPLPESKWVVLGGRYRSNDRCWKFVQVQRSKGLLVSPRGNYLLSPLSDSHLTSCLQKRREQKLIEDGGVSQTELRSFQLTANYRSHAGIINCSTEVIRLIMTFWPYAIDTMKPEKGFVGGPKPVFFSGWDTNTVRYEQFLFGDS